MRPAELSQFSTSLTESTTKEEKPILSPCPISMTADVIKKDSLVLTR